MRDKIALLFLVVLIVVSAVTASPRSRQWKPFFIESWNPGTRLSTIWKYQPGEKQVSQIFVLHNTATPAAVLFSSQELADLQHYRKAQSTEDDAQWGQQNPPSQQIAEIWRFDPTHLLVQTTNDIQDPFGRGGDNNESGRFGYHEFLTLDVTNPQRLQHLFSIDYHDRAYESWEGCALPFAYPTDLTLNPTQDKLAFVLGPGRNLCSLDYLTTLIIADYSVFPVRFTRIPSAGHPVWSPDGTHLAYMHAQNTGNPGHQGFHYDLSLEIQTVATGQVMVVDSLPGLTHNMELNTFAWADNSTLIYKWYPSPYDDPPPLYKVYQWVHLKQPVEVPVDSMLNLQFMYPIMENGKPPAYLLGQSGYSTDHTPNTFILSPQMPLWNFKSLRFDQTPIYNSRFPNRILFLGSQTSGDGKFQVTAFDLNFNIIHIDLSTILPADEWVYYDLAP